MTIASAFQHLAPELPDYQARYRAVYFEPIAHSGERFTVGILAQSQAGEHTVLQTLSSQAMRCMYGENHPAFANLIGLVLESAKAHLDAKLPLEEWAPPLGGIDLSDIQTTYSNAGMEGVLFQAVSNYASLYQGEIVTKGLNDLAGIEPKEESDSDTGLIQRVKAILVNCDGRFSGRWRQEVVVKDGAKVKIDYLGAHYNANLSNFDVKQIGHAYNLAKAKLFDLEVLREKRSREALDNQQRYELLIALSETERREAHDRYREIETLADGLELRVVKKSTAEQLADRIMQQDAA